MPLISQTSMSGCRLRRMLRPSGNVRHLLKEIIFSLYSFWMSLFNHPPKVQPLQNLARAFIMTPPSVTFGFANFGKGAKIETVDEAQKFLDVLKTHKVNFVSIILPFTIWKKRGQLFICLFQLPSFFLRSTCSSLQIDTSRRYADGGSEEILGELGASQEFKVSTKIFPALSTKTPG